MNSPTQKLARRREQEWIEKHGRHDYAGRNLRREALEELADAYNYLRARRCGCSVCEDIDLAEKALELGDELARRMEAS